MDRVDDCNRSGVGGFVSRGLSTLNSRTLGRELPGVVSELGRLTLGVRGRDGLPTGV